MKVSDVLPLLRRLALVEVAWYDTNTSDLTEDESLPRAMYTSSKNKLVDVVLDCFGMVRPLLWLVGSQRSIQRLAIGHLALSQRRRQPQVALLSDVLRALGPCLEHLIISETDNNLLDLSRTTALRTLQMIGIRSVVPPHTSVDVAWVHNLLSGICSPDLQRIVFAANVHDCLREDTGLQWVDFFVPGNRSSAFFGAIDERLAAKTYVLKVEEKSILSYAYGLGAFDI
ncbi:hypothetical protein C8R44DRAFT_741374 [Mycena epipterygia]|nr:hypothetical protein C8R44DRAFT_741374 [Mycena epipterygia]